MMRTIIRMLFRALAVIASPVVGEELGDVSAGLATETVQFRQLTISLLSPTSLAKPDHVPGEGDIVASEYYLARDADVVLIVSCLETRLGAWPNLDRGLQGWLPEYAKGLGFQGLPEYVKTPRNVSGLTGFLASGTFESLGTNTAFSTLNFGDARRGCHVSLFFPEESRRAQEVASRIIESVEVKLDPSASDEVFERDEGGLVKPLFGRDKAIPWPVPMSDDHKALTFWGRGNQSSSEFTLAGDAALRISARQGPFQLRVKRQNESFLRDVARTEEADGGLLLMAIPEGGTYQIVIESPAEWGVTVVFEE